MPYFTNRGIIPLPSAGYSGPGDIVSGASAWWGLRAYSSAQCTGSQQAIAINDAGGSNNLTLNITTTGDLDKVTLDAWIVAHGTAYVAQFYDQTGNNRHLINIASVATQPFINTTGSGGHYTLQFDGARNIKTTANLSIGAQPLCCTWVGNVTSAAADQYMVACDDTDTVRVKYNFATGFVVIGAGVNDVGLAISQTTFHAFKGHANGAGSLVRLDGTTSGTVDIGSNGPTRLGYLGVDFTSGSLLTGNVCETGWWSGDKTGLFAALETNERTYWGI